MPRYITLSLLLALMLPVGALIAQEKPASVKEKTGVTQATTPSSGTTDPKFVDADGDGIDDKKTSETAKTTEDSPRLRQRARARDRFVDTDGDGINDNRSCGVGVSGGTNKGRRWGKQ